MRKIKQDISAAGGGSRDGGSLGFNAAKNASAAEPAKESATGTDLMAALAVVVQGVAADILGVPSSVRAALHILA